MSGKGGVGYRIGLLDADVYGCSIPRLLSVSQKDLIETIQVNSLPVALVKNTNIQCASLRLLSSKDSPLAWRGLINKRLEFNTCSCAAAYGVATNKRSVIERRSLSVKITSPVPGGQSTTK
ncbi:hypothetical protein ACOME3_010645 [Neoechinorhynchus agilis]